jgi:hypothetical protein
MSGVSNGTRENTRLIRSYIILARVNTGVIPCSATVNCLTAHEPSYPALGCYCYGVFFFLLGQDF